MSGCYGEKPPPNPPNRTHPHSCTRSYTATLTHTYTAAKGLFRFLSQVKVGALAKTAYLKRKISGKAAESQ